MLLEIIFLTYLIAFSLPAFYSVVYMTTLIATAIFTCAYLMLCKYTGSIKYAKPVNNFDGLRFIILVASIIWTSLASLHFACFDMSGEPDVNSCPQTTFKTFHVVTSMTTTSYVLSFLIIEALGCFQWQIEANANPCCGS